MTVDVRAGSLFFQFASIEKKWKSPDQRKVEPSLVSKNPFALIQMYPIRLIFVSFAATYPIYKPESPTDTVVRPLAHIIKPIWAYKEIKPESPARVFE